MKYGLRCRYLGPGPDIWDQSQWEGTRDLSIKQVFQEILQFTEVRELLLMDI